MTLDARQFGLRLDGVTDDRAALQRALDAAPDDSVLVIPPGVCRLAGNPFPAADFWAADRSAPLDTPSAASLRLFKRRKLTIRAEGVTFLCPDAYTAYFYGCNGCRWIGGVFTGQDAYRAGREEASAIVVARSVDCWVEDARFDRFYRNLFFLQSSASGARRCRSANAGYFCFYGSAFHPTARNLPGATAVNHTVFDGCVAEGGRYGNFFLENATAENCTSLACGRQGVPSAHVSTNKAPFWFVGSRISETSDQNIGNPVDGVVVASSRIFLDLQAVDGSRVAGNTIGGCRKAVVLVGASNSRIEENRISGFYLAGIHAYTRRVVGVPARLINTIISNNRVGPFERRSNLTGSGYLTKAAVAVEANDGIRVERAVVVSNVIDGNAAGSITPAGQWFELSCTDPNVEIGPNDFRGTGPQRRP